MTVISWQSARVVVPPGVMTVVSSGSGNLQAASDTSFVGTHQRCDMKWDDNHRYQQSESNVGPRAILDRCGDDRNRPQTTRVNFRALPCKADFASDIT